MSGASPSPRATTADDAAAAAGRARPPFATTSALILMAGIAVGLLAGQALMRVAHARFTSV
jgi:predicted lipid-binding transport protein (Tim44 family)